MPAVESGANPKPTPPAVPQVGSGAEPNATPAPRRFALVGGTVVGVGRRDITVQGANIEAVGQAEAAIERIDVSGSYLAPAFIDAHVHLTYFRAAEALLSRGVAAAVDLAAPLDSLTLSVAPLTLLQSGPMVTAIGGYPTASWGSAGYGLEVASREAAEAAVDQLFKAGAAIIKVPFTGEPTLSDEIASAVVARAHAHELKVVAHALSSAEAERAANAGVDLFAHTPTGALTETTLAAFSSRAVVSTLAAFGGSAQTVANLKALRARGTTVLYGTDLGNTRDAGIQASEIELLELSGLDGSAILEAGTSAPARYFGLSSLGELAVGKRAAILVLAEDPQAEPKTLAAPRAVYIDGQIRR